MNSPILIIRPGRTLAPIFEFQHHRGWNDMVGAPKLRASAALFSLGRKGSYFAAKSGGKVTANG